MNDSVTVRRTGDRFRWNDAMESASLDATAVVLAMHFDDETPGLFRAQLSAMQDGAAATFSRGARSRARAPVPIPPVSISPANTEALLRALIDRLPTCPATLAHAAPWTRPCAAPSTRGRPATLTMACDVHGVTAADGADAVAEWIDLPYADTIRLAARYLAALDVAHVARFDVLTPAAWDALRAAAEAGCVGEDDAARRAVRELATHALVTVGRETQPGGALGDRRVQRVRANPAGRALLAAWTRVRGSTTQSTEGLPTR